jgi:predicted GNAT family acetyltransferase
MTDENQSEQMVVTEVSARHRYEIRVDGAVAGYAAYQSGDGQIVFTHTQVDPNFEGRGVGSALAAAALADARRQGLRVVPRCPFFAAYIHRHPEYADLL